MESISFNFEIRFLILNPPPSILIKNSAFLSSGTRCFETDKFSNKEGVKTLVSSEDLFEIKKSFVL